MSQPLKHLCHNVFAKVSGREATIQECFRKVSAEQFSDRSSMPSDRDRIVAAFHIYGYLVENSSYYISNSNLDFKHIQSLFS